jgi:hypothetical protein
VHPNHENIFVVGSIEDHYLAFAGRAEVSAPEKIVSDLVIARLLEPKDERPLRVHSAEDVPDDAILAGGVECLQYDEQRLVAVRVKSNLRPLLVTDDFKP